MGVANATVGMEVCKAGQPHSGVRVCEGEGDAVRAGLWDRRPPLHLEVHRVRSLRGTVHPGGCQGVLVVAPGDLWKYEHQRQCEPHTHTQLLPRPPGQERAVRWCEQSHVTFKAKLFMVQMKISC